MKIKIFDSGDSLCNGSNMCVDNTEHGSLGLVWFCEQGANFVNKHSEKSADFVFGSPVM